MKKIIGNEVWEISGEEELDKYFPKGDKRRGEALMVLASTKLEEREKILKIIDINKLREEFDRRISLGCLEKEAFIFILQDLKKKVENEDWICRRIFVCGV